MDPITSQTLTLLDKNGLRGCGICGKHVRGKDRELRGHITRLHMPKGSRLVEVVEDRMRLQPGQLQVEQPYCDNWRERIEQAANGKEIVPPVNAKLHQGQLQLVQGVQARKRTREKAITKSYISQAPPDLEDIHMFEDILSDEEIEELEDSLNRRQQKQSRKHALHVKCVPEKSLIQKEELDPKCIDSKTDIQKFQIMPPPKKQIACGDEENSVHILKQENYLRETCYNRVKEMIHMSSSKPFKVAVTLCDFFQMQENIFIDFDDSWLQKSLYDAAEFIALEKEQFFDKVLNQILNLTNFGGISAKRFVNPFLFYLWFNLEQRNNLQALNIVCERIEKEFTSNKNELQEAKNCVIQYLERKFGIQSDVAELLWDDRSKITNYHFYLLIAQKHKKIPKLAEVLKLITNIKFDHQFTIHDLKDLWMSLNQQSDIILRPIRKLIREARFEWKVTGQFLQEVVELIQKNVINLGENCIPETMLCDYENPEHWVTILKKMSTIERPLHVLKSNKSPYIDIRAMNSRILENDNVEVLPKDHIALSGEVNNQFKNTSKDIAIHNTELSANQDQYAYAQYAMFAAFHQGPQRISVSLGPGGGKTRIAMTSAWMALDSGRAERVTFVYPTQYVLDRDRDEYRDMFRTIAQFDSVFWQTKQEFCRPQLFHKNRDIQKSKHLLIFDEADQFVLEDTLSFYRGVEDHPVIALTASTGERGFEQKVFGELRFRPHLSPPSGLLQSHTEFSCLDEEKLSKMLKNLSQPILIFCTIQQLDKFKQVDCAEHYVNEQIIKSPRGSLNDVENGEDGKIVNSLNLRSLEGMKRLWATEEQYLRAIDYRSADRTIPLHLVILRSFSSQRALKQGKGRVGRQGDACERYILDGVDEVDTENELQLIAKTNTQIKQIAEIKKREEDQKNLSRRKGNKNPGQLPIGQKRIQVNSDDQKMLTKVKNTHISQRSQQILNNSYTVVKAQQSPDV